MMLVCLSLPNDDVETTLLACLSPEVWGLVFWCYRGVLSRMEATSQDRSTEQMVLYGVGSVYYGNRGQKVLSVEWFLSMQAKRIHICYTYLIFHVKYPSYCLYATHDLQSLTHSLKSISPAC